MTVNYAVDRAKMPTLFKRFSLYTLLCLMTFGTLEILTMVIGQRSYFLDPALFVPNAATVYGNRPGFRGYYAGVFVSINSMGQRGDDFPQSKAANEFRVLLLGDSVTFGQAVEQHHIFSAHLETLLNAGQARSYYRVINAGVPGFNTMDESNYLRAFGDALNPDLVIVTYVHNDTVPSAFRGFDERGVPIKNDGSSPLRGDLREQVSTWLYRHSALYNVLRRAEVVLRFHLDGPGFDILNSNESYTRWVTKEFSDDNPRFKESKEALRAMKMWADKRRKAFRLAVFSWFPPSAEDRYRDVLTAFGRAERIAIIHLSPLQDGDQLRDYSVLFEGHPNERAHERIAMSLYQEIRGFLDGARTVRRRGAIKPFEERDG